MVNRRGITSLHNPKVSRLFLITGCPGSGKTTTSEALLKRFPLGLRISVDDLRDQVVSGMAHPIPEWTEEANRQFNLARAAAAAMARIYLEAGFAVAIDDTIPIHKADAMLAPLAEWSPIRILLVPTVEKCLERNRTRTGKNFDAKVLADAIAWMHPEILKGHADAPGYIKVDNGDIGLEETVDRILEVASTHHA